MNYFVLHWDVALSAASCAKILSAVRGPLGYLLHREFGSGVPATGLPEYRMARRRWTQLQIRGSGDKQMPTTSDRYQSWYVRNGFGEKTRASGMDMFMVGP